MHEPPATDWDLIHRWEWFRRIRWRESFRASLHGLGGGLTRAFSDLARQSGSELLLDASCGLGRRAVVISELGHNVLGSDQSGVSVAKSRELARDEGSPATFFQSSWETLPQNVPHHFDGILSSGLEKSTTFDKLGAALVGMFHSLRPGGFLMWTGVGESDPTDTGQRRLADAWEGEPPEKVEWFHREGRLTACLVRQWRRESDFVDERRLYISENNGSNTLETTTIRWPGYWTWTHWKDLVRMAGFTHLETRRLEYYGVDGGPLAVNIAWKAKA